MSKQIKYVFLHYKADGETIEFEDVHYEDITEDEDLAELMKHEYTDLARDLIQEWLFAMVLQQNQKHIFAMYLIDTEDPSVMDLLDSGIHDSDDKIVFESDLVLPITIADADEFDVLESGAPYSQAECGVVGLAKGYEQVEVVHSDGSPEWVIKKVG